MEPFALTVTRFLGKPYLPGGSGDEGFGCINFIYEFLRARGKENIKTDVDGVNLHNYCEFIEHATQEEIKEKLVKAFDQNGERVKTPMVGDCLVLKARGGEYFPAIYSGNKTIITSFNNAGVEVTPMGYYELIGAWRI